MGRLERFLWGAVYFGSALALIVALYALQIEGSAATISSFAIASLTLGAWHRFKPEIIRGMAWGARTIIARVRAAINPYTVGLLRSWSRVTRSHDLELWIVAGSDEQLELRRNALAAAIELVEAVSPSRYARLRALNPVIFVGPVPGAGMHVMNTRVVGIEGTVVDRWTAESVACVLCHELIHFRLWQRGVKWSPWTNTREELIADREMCLWPARLIRRGNLSEQASAELMELIRVNRQRWWWTRAGTRFHGSEVETAPGSETPPQAEFTTRA